MAARHAENLKISVFPSPRKTARTDENPPRIGKLQGSFDSAQDDNVLTVTSLFSSSVP